MFGLTNRKKFLFRVKIGFYFPEIHFAAFFPGSNFLLSTFPTGGKLDFQVVNLLLATVNFKPCQCYIRSFDESECVGMKQETLHRIL